MKHTIIALALLACMGTTVAAENPQQAFIKGWKGQSVVVKTGLYSLIFNERGKLGTTRSGQRDGLLVVTPLRGHYFRFDGRQGRDTVLADNPDMLIKAVHAEYEVDALDVRPYRKLDPLAIHRFEPGIELVISNVRIGADEVKFEFADSRGRKDPVTSLCVKWPLPLSPSFDERAALEEVVRKFIEVKSPAAR